jgi:predicted metalloprotease
MGGLGAGGLLGIFSLLGRFGWKGILIGVVVVGYLMFGGGTCGMSNCAMLGGGAPTAPTQTKTTGGADPQDEQVKFVGFVFDDVQASWNKRLEGYTGATIVVFRGAVDSACGTADAAVGPFYCPLDKKVYIDLSFYEELSRRFGLHGDFAEAYVIAHEVGHHVQNLAGRMGRGESESIELELQADCLAGAWAHDAEARKLLEVGDIDEALGAAAAVGDDNIQKKTQGRIQPESWTHGSAKQRADSFRKGYRGGSASSCGL